MARSYSRELVGNQVWHALNFASKAAFLALLTPLLLSQWGEERYGVFALASSLVVSLALMDAGVRDATRLALCEAREHDDSDRFSDDLLRGVVTFTSVAGLVYLLAVYLATQGLWSSWLQLSGGDDWIIAHTVGLTGLMMASVLALEPLAADNELSAVKMAGTLGAMIAIPAVAATVWWGGGVFAALAANFACMLAANVGLFVHRGLARRVSWSRIVLVRPRHLFETFRASRSMYFVSTVWILRTHALTFLVSTLVGPAAAGFFYILLRLSEVISTLGGASSETVVASVTSGRDLAERAARFVQAYRFGACVCAFSALGLAVLATPLVALVSRIVGEPFAINDTTAIATASYGLANVIILYVFRASIATNTVRFAAVGSAFSALVVIGGGWLLQRQVGSAGTLAAGAISVFALVPAARAVAVRLEESPWRLWVGSLAGLTGPWALGAILLLAARWIAHPIAIAAAIVGVGVLLLRQWRGLHRTETT